jgi:cell division septal protein FtsQ
MISFGSKKPSKDIPRRRRVDQVETVEQARSGTQYRRNQTLSGVSRTSIADSPRGQAHQLTIHRRKIGGLFGIVLVAVIFLGILVSQLMAQVSVASSTKQLAAPFEGATYEKVVDSYLGLHPAERLRFALDEAALSTYVSASLPEVESIKVSGVKDIVDTQFAVTFRQPVAGWQINGNQFYVDAAGVVFETNYYDAPTIQIVDESGVSPQEGTTVAGSRLLGFLGKVVSQVGERGYIVTQAILPAGMTRELDIQLKDTASRIKLSTDRGAGEQVEDLARSLTYLQSKNITPEYIDVRVSGRAAYK